MYRAQSLIVSSRRRTRCTICEIELGGGIAILQKRIRKLGGELGV